MQSILVEISIEQLPKKKKRIVDLSYIKYVAWFKLIIF